MCRKKSWDTCLVLEWKMSKLEALSLLVPGPVRRSARRSLGGGVSQWCYRAAGLEDEIWKLELRIGVVFVPSCTRRTCNMNEAEACFRPSQEYCLSKLLSASIYRTEPDWRGWTVEPSTFLARFVWSWPPVWPWFLVEDVALFQVAGNFKVGCDHFSWIGPNLLHLLPRISFGIPLEAGPISRGEGKQVARVCATLSHRYLVVAG